MAKTDNYEFNLPTVGASEDEWGGELNENWESVDSKIKEIEDREIATSGIATGGGDLSDDRTINVPGTDLGSSGSGNSRTITSSTGANTTIEFSVGDFDAVSYAAQSLSGSEQEQARGNIGLGTAAVEDVTTSPTDTTPGRVTLTGYMGLGSDTGIALTSQDDLDDIRDAGFYSWSGISVPANAPGSFFGAMIVLPHLSNDANDTAQLVFRVGGASTQGDSFIRAYGAGEWQQWLPNYTGQNIIGTVSEDSGVPTGAIIQRGSGPNGEFVRFADGTQICWHKLILTGDGFNLSAFWTLPATFTSYVLSAVADIENLDISISSGAVGWLRCGVGGGGTFSAPRFLIARISGMDNYESGDEMQLHVKATGRWY